MPHRPKELHERVREALPGFTFRPPAMEMDVRRVERELRFPLPPEICQLYLHFDGVYPHSRSAIELLPLVGDASAERESVLGWNLFRKGAGWGEGYEPQQDVLELGFSARTITSGSAPSAAK